MLASTELPGILWHYGMTKHSSSENAAILGVCRMLELADMSVPGIGHILD